MSTLISNQVKSVSVGKLDEQARARLLSWMKAQMTQAEFGRRIGRDSVWVSRYFGEYYDADLDTLKKMAEACGRTLYELFDVIPPNAEGTLVAAFRKLTETDRHTVLKVAEGMSPPDKPSRKRKPRGG